MRNSPSTLVDLLRYRALAQPSQAAFIFLQEGETEAAKLTYQDLERRALAIAAYLQSLGCSGERALLLYPSGLEFVVAFFGCLYAGVVAVPAYPPHPNRSLTRLRAIASDAQAKFSLTTTSILESLEQSLVKNPELAQLKWLTTDNLFSSQEADWQDPAISSDNLAFLQYTSGSTGTPKGVMVSHANLLYNSECIKKAFELGSDSVSVTWLPSFHDMGLVDGILQPIYSGFLGVVLPPVAFLQRPIRWLQAISRYRATHCGGPNFGYEACIRKIAPEQMENLDLSCWSSAYSGAEPVRKETLELFTAKFKPYGFQARFFYPCYGMAETTLMVSGISIHEEPVYLAVEAAAIEQNRVVAASEDTKTEDSKKVRYLVGCGHSWRDTKIAIADPETLVQCSDDQVGEILVSGSSVTQGYWNRPEQTEKTFQAYLTDTGEGPFLRTGDLGFVRGNELFVTGRIKDLLIIRGRNHYPQDIELTIQKSHPALRLESGAAFTVEVDQEERLAIAQEVERTHLRKLKVDEVVEAVRKAVSQEHELQVDAVVLLKLGGILKTSSGKIQRQACRVAFLEGSLDVVGIWKSAVMTPEQSSEDLELESARSSSSLHNFLYSAARVKPLTLKLPITHQAADPETLSKMRADEAIQWLRSYANERINSQLIDERRCIPPYIVLDLGNRGILGMQVPEQYGGMSLNYRDTLRVFEQMAAIDLNLAAFVGVHHALGTRPIMNYAQPAVRDEMLPLIARGLELGAFAITEPGAGSNPRSISSTAVPDGNGGWRLRGQKIWIGSGSWAGIINVFVQLLDANHQPTGITGFTVRQGTKGLRQGTEALTMGMRGMVQNRMHLDDIAVDRENLLGELSNGMVVAQDAMMFGRLGLGAISLGGMKRCAQLMLRYAENRSISTGRLSDNPLTLAQLSDLTAAIAALEALIFKIAKLLDEAATIPVEIYAACKISGPEFLWKAADRLVQLLGGRGYIETNIASQILRDARLLRIFEGPTETLNMFLGSRTLNHSEELHQFLCDSLGATVVAQKLRTAADKINERCIKYQNIFSDRTSAIRWASAIAGEIATFAILLAAVQAALETSKSEQLRRSAIWAHLHFEQKLEQALSDSPIESALLGADTANATVSSYIEAIGDLEQTLAGEDNQLDELLLREIGANTYAEPIEKI